jgi:hypothetical protein
MLYFELQVQRHVLQDILYILFSYDDIHVLLLYKRKSKKIKDKNKKNNLTDFFVNAFLVFVLDHHLLHVVAFDDVDVDYDDDDLMMVDLKNLMKMMEMVNLYLMLDLIYKSMSNQSDLQLLLNRN